MLKAMRKAMLKAMLKAILKNGRTNFCCVFNSSAYFMASSSSLVAEQFVVFCKKGNLHFLVGQD